MCLVKCYSARVEVVLLGWLVCVVGCAVCVCVCVCACAGCGVHTTRGGRGVNEQGHKLCVCVCCGGCGGGGVWGGVGVGRMKKGEFKLKAEPSPQGWRYPTA